MPDLAKRSYFLACLALGRLLRESKYSKTEIVQHKGEPQVRKRRLFYAPFLVLLGEPLVRLLHTGVRVLPQREWEERERDLYCRLYGASIRADRGGTLVLPFLPGKTLAALLETPDLVDPARKSALVLAAGRLAHLHRLGITHGDAMAENVMIDLDARVAHLFDFETVHDEGRSMLWRRADDLRALLATSLVRTAPQKFAETCYLVLDAYGDEEVARLVGESFGSVLQRPLAFHLGQAALSFERFREIDRLLSERLGG